MGPTVDGFRAYQWICPQCSEINEMERPNRFGEPQDEHCIHCGLEVKVVVDSNE